jgi:uncharacterized RDD family membrane protein YckC
MNSLPEGWYKDPADPTTQRWWDGEGWLGKAVPADQTPPDGPPPADDPPADDLEPVAPVEPPVAAAPATPEAPVPPRDAPPPAQGWDPPVPPRDAPPPAQGWGPPAPPLNAPPPAQGWGPPPGWVPTPQGWQPPPGWVPPPGWAPQPGAFPYAYAMPEARPHGLPLAGLGHRLAARLIDIVIVLILNVIVNGWFAYQWWLEVAPMVRAAMRTPLGTVNEQPSLRSSYLILTMLVVATALWFAYEVPALANSGQTLGKRLLHVRVFGLEGTGQIGFARATRRWARLGVWTMLWGCWGIGLLIQAINSLSPVFDPRLRQAVYDKTVHTVVLAVPAGYRAPVQATEPPGGEK